MGIGLQVGFGERFGLEGGVFGRGGERKMHLRGASAEKRGGFEVEPGALSGLLRNVGFGEEGGGRAFIGWRGAGGRGFVKEGEFVECPLPSVTLVGDEALEHGGGGALAGGGDGGDLAEEGSNTREVRDFGEEATDLDVGIFAGLEAAEKFEDDLRTVKDVGVGLLGGADAGGQRAGSAGLGEDGGLAAKQSSGVAGGPRICDGWRGEREGLSLLDDCEKRLAEVFAYGRVVEDGGAVWHDQRGENALGHGGVDGFQILAGGESEGDLVEVGGTLDISDFDKEQGGRAGSWVTVWFRGCPVDDADGLNGAALGAKPSLTCEPGGEAGFEQGKTGAGGECFPVAGLQIERELGAFVADSGLVDDGLVGLRWGGLELKPEEGVGRDGEGVGGGANLREGDIPEHLDGYGAGVGSEIERDGLSETREIGDAKDGFVGAVVTLQVAKIGEDFAVLRMEKGEGAAAEDLEEFAQGDHVARPVKERGLIA